MTTTTTQTILAAEARLRERLAAVTAAWRLLDDEIEDALGMLDTISGRELERHRQRMADALDRLEQTWILRPTGGQR